MVKIASSLLVAALTLASSSTLAAPTPTTATEAENTTVRDDSFEAAGPNSKETEKFEAKLLMLAKKDHTAAIANDGSKFSGRSSASENMRRSIPLVASGTNFLEKRDTLTKRGDVVTTLGLAGALAPLGLGGIVSTVENAIGGLPLVGGPVAGLVKTVDGTVGISSLLNPVAAAPHAKRQSLDGLFGSFGGSGTYNGGLGGTTGSVTGTLGGLTSALPVGAVAGQLGGLSGTASGILGNLPLGTVTGTLGGVAGGLPLGAATGVVGGVASNLPGNVGGNVGGLLQGLTIAQAEALGLIPAGFVHALAVNIVAQETGTQIPDTPINAVANQLLVNNYHHQNSTDSAQPDPVQPADHEPRFTPSGESATTTSSTTGDSVSANLSTSSTSSSAAPFGTPAVDLTLPDNTTYNTTMSISTPVNVMPTSMWSSVPTPVSSAVSTASSAEPTPTNRFAVTSPSSASEYSDSDGEDDDDEDEDDEEDDDATTSTQPTKSAGWKITSSSTMAPTSSQAQYTTQAMSLTASEAGINAVPTTTGGAKRFARSQD